MFPNDSLIYLYVPNGFFAFQGMESLVLQLQKLKPRKALPKAVNQIIAPCCSHWLFDHYHGNYPMENLN